MDYSQLKTEVRAASGWSSVDDLSVARIERAINYIYTRKIVHFLNWNGLQDWIFLELALDTGVYLFTSFVDAKTGGASLGTRVRNIYTPVLMHYDDDQVVHLGLTENKDNFWKKYPPIANEDSNVPADILRTGKTLHIRPLPDAATYVVQCWSNLRPAALSTDTDEPIEDWSEAIIAGAVALIAEEDEETDKALLYWGIFENRLQTEVEDDYSHPPGKVKGQW